jgi:metal-sulfur cluster biosynthetic enzyme
MSRVTEPADPVRAAVLAQADAIADPCSVASGLDLGLAEMGLIRDVRITEGDRGLEVGITLRLTAPGCFYYLYFERELTNRIGALPGIAGVTVVRDAAYDWTEDDIAPRARTRLRERRRRRRDELTRQTTTPMPARTQETP